MAKSKITSCDIVKRLHERYDSPRYSAFTELRNSNTTNSRRTIDFFAIGNWSKTVDSVAVEVKISRSDFQRELDDPSKRELWEKEAMECWFAIPAGLIKPEEIPEGWGLLEVCGEGLRSKRKAPQRRVEQSKAVMRSMIRRASEEEAEARRKEEPYAHLLGRKVTFTDLRRLAEKLHGTG